MARELTIDEARDLGEKIGISFGVVSLEQFREGLLIELEHGKQDSDTNITDDDPVATAKIAWAHLKEIPDYYTRLNIMEDEAESPYNT